MLSALGKEISSRPRLWIPTSVRVLLRFVASHAEKVFIGVAQDQMYLLTRAAASDHRVFRVVDDTSEGNPDACTPTSNCSIAVPKIFLKLIAFTICTLPTKGPNDKCREDEEMHLRHGDKHKMRSGNLRTLSQRLRSQTLKIVFGTQVNRA